jgi:ABC-type transporter Mla MlaB component
MKTSKRKRSSKAASVAEASGVDVVTAETSVAAEPVVEAVVEVAAELSAVADVSNEAVVESVVEIAAEPVSDETVVAEASVEPAAAAEPAVVGDPLVVLAANCSVKDAAALKTSLCAFSNHGDAVTLDVSAVERVDTATMQLLCAFVRDRGGRNQGVTWRGESAALQDAVRLLGVGALLGLETKGVAA